MEESKPASSLAVASFPLLVYDHGEEEDNSQIMLSVADGSSRTYQIPEMSNYTFLVTPSGWVLLVDNASLQTSLWNPQTGEKIPLPAMEKELPECCHCLLSGTVSSPDCLVLVYDLDEPELLYCQIRGEGAATWLTQSYDLGRRKLPATGPDSHSPAKRTIDGMAAVEGKFYFIQPESADVVGVLSLADHDDLEQLPRLEMTGFYAPMPKFVDDGATHVYIPYVLGSSSCQQQQELLLVSVIFHHLTLQRVVGEVRAYKMDLSEQRWCRVTDIGDAAFLLGPGSFAASCSSATERGLKRGCVYFANDFLGDSNDYHVFDLVDGSRELAGPAQDMPPVLSCKPFWLVPIVP